MNSSRRLAPLLALLSCTTALSYRSTWGDQTPNGGAFQPRYQQEDTRALQRSSYLSYPGQKTPYTYPEYNPNVGYDARTPYTANQRAWYPYIFNREKKKKKEKEAMMAQSMGGKAPPPSPPKTKTRKLPFQLWALTNLGLQTRLLVRQFSCSIVLMFFFLCSFTFLFQV